MPVAHASTATKGRILFLQYANPALYPPIEHAAAILAGAGFALTVLGIASAAAPLAFTERSGVYVELLPTVTRGWRLKLHYLRFVVRACAWVVRWRPTWIYASDPLSCPAALVARGLSGAKLVYHEHDSPEPPGSEPRAAVSAFMRLVFRARRAVARRADIDVLPNRERAEAFGRSVGRDGAIVVWNCPASDEVLVRPRAPARPNALRVLYHGSIVPARVPHAVIEALALTPPDISLVIVGYETAGHPRYVEELMAIATEHGVAERIAFLGPMARSPLMAHCATCDVGLALLPLDSQDFNERTMTGASNKPFDYLACGLTLLVADLPAWRSLYVDPGMALACDPGSAEDIASKLSWLLDHPEARAEMAERGRRRVLDEWNYEREFQPVLSRMMGGAPA